MIEEIVKTQGFPFTELALIFLFSGLIVGFVSVFKDSIHGIGFGLTLAVVGLCFMFGGIILDDSEELWREAVQQQIDSLPCEDLQEADELYGFDSIEEKFLYECVETREDWWK